MNEMVERVTKAILDAMDLTDGLDAGSAERYARAAIEAMRVPTKEMAVAGDDALDECVDSDWSSDADGNRHDYTTIRSDAPGTVYSAMIDAALKAP